MKGSIVLSLAGLAAGGVIPQGDGPDAPARRQVRFQGVDISGPTSGMEKRAADVVSTNFVEMEKSPSDHSVPMNTWEGLKTSHLYESLQDGWELAEDGTAATPAVSNMTLIW